ncbi:MAG: histone deacetylase family protein [Nanoarchaeota archaeon]|nr:histone deacetylase family protein [Nanoarchaeota archaeon]MBU1854474.1 histone deacetylase family protein [Nanoarchaeota archaeon]
MHPENKKRLEVFGNIKETEVPNGEEYLKLFHTKKYIDYVKKMCLKEGHTDPDTIVSKKTYETAIHAVGATIKACEKNDFALVRPPGHHAHPDRSSGFCIFNNISIATKKLLNEGKRVLIFDFDGHAGDGTLKHFYNTKEVLYMSLHQFPAFPNTGTENQIGEGKGKGYTVNVPLPPEAGDDIYIEAVKKIIPIAKQFKPDIVALSAGFDSHQYDLLLDLRLSINTYYWLGKIIRKEFKNVFATLEGGYNIDILPKCVYNFLDGINGKKQRFKEAKTDSKFITIQEFQGRMALLEHNLSKYWNLKR